MASERPSTLATSPRPTCAVNEFEAGQGSVLAVAREDRVGERMLAALLRACGKAQQFVLAHRRNRRSRR